MNNNDPGKTFYKMSWIDYVENNDLRRTVKHGFMLYIVVAMLAVPSALCSQQHMVTDFKVPILDFATDIIVEPMPGESVQEQPDRPLSDGCTEDTEADVVTEASAPQKDILPFNEHIMQAAQAYEVDPTLIRAVIVAESGFDPQAVSKRGAQGLMQLMPTTAKWLGVEDSFNPAMNIDGGVRYLRRLIDRFDGDIRLALAAYNAGSRYVRKYGGIPPFKATRIYIKKVLHYQKKFKNEMAIGEDSDSSV